MRSKDDRLWTKGNRLSQPQTDTDAVRSRFWGGIGNDWSATLRWSQHQRRAVEFWTVE
jgi:hypothetical protein